MLYCGHEDAQCRTNEVVRQNMIEAHLTKKRVNGYHGISVLLALNYDFDVVSQVAIDKMHCVDLGVIRKLFNIFLDSKNRHKE